MSDTMAGLRRKIVTAQDLHAVVRTMKALAASSIGRYEDSVRALTDYSRTVELGLGACFRDMESRQVPVQPNPKRDAAAIRVVVFGSDQGLVGQFNELMANYTVKTLAALPGKHQVWAVGDRIHARLADLGLPLKGLFPVPTSVEAISTLVGEIQIETGSHQPKSVEAPLFVFHNRPLTTGLYEPVSQRLLPLDEEWQRELIQVPWPTKRRPEVIGGGNAAVSALVSEYLYISLFRACAESLASENASRLSAMNRADKNIIELLEVLQSTLRRQRQERIDEEMFDVISGYEALSKEPSPGR